MRRHYLGPNNTAHSLFSTHTYLYRTPKQLKLCLVRHQTLTLCGTCSPVDAAAPFVYERIDKDDVALLVVDHQEGLYLISRDRPAVDIKSSILAHATLAKIFNLHTVLTTSTQTGTFHTVVYSGISVTSMTNGYQTYRP